MLLMTQFIVTTDRESSVSRAAERAYRTRLFGFGLAFFCVGSVLLEHAAKPWVWGILVANAFLWPHAARVLALRSRDPVAAEMRNLLIDSVMGGMWIALMHFNLLPSVLLAVVLAVDKMRAGGWLLLLRGLAVQLAACVVAAAIHGLAFAPQSTMLDILASLPLLVAYPLAMAVSSRSLMRTIRDQNRQLAQLHRHGPIAELAEP
ncbi:MAG TPA: MASE2 domain-containing protein [Rudaea sp.]|nr:MASE2 domain-containing protein [Rudaea sp.]